MLAVVFQKVQVKIEEHVRIVVDTTAHQAWNIDGIL